jgi:DNA replication protein DnaC
MSELLHDRVVDCLVQLKLRHAVVRLDAIVEEGAEASWTYLQFLERLLGDELDAKRRKRIAMGLQIAHFPSVKVLNAFDFAFQKTVDEKLVQELSTGSFIRTAHNVLLLGPPGVGKTHLAIALGRSAVEAGSTVLFTEAKAILGSLARAEADGVLEDKLAYYRKPKLLIIDELGYLTLETRSAHLLFQLIARRYEHGSTMITSNRPVAQWGDIFGDDTTAAAILDRLLHHCHVINISGDSYRLKNKRRAGVLSSGSAKPPISVA